jgi:succinate dehydrogenase / fumarate reductase, cytochrome b subunit
MADSKPSASRPLSPHLEIYRPEITMVMSILHRITGTALYLGTVLLAAWLLAVASSETAFLWVQWFLGSLVGRLVLLGFTWALLHHMLGGVRHLVWDTGRGLEREQRFFLSRFTLIGSLVLTLVVWVVAYALR